MSRFRIRALIASVALLISLGSGTAPAGEVTYWFLRNGSSTVYQVFAQVSGDDTLGLYAYAFVIDVDNSSNVSWTHNFYLDGVLQDFVFHGILLDVAGPVGPSLFNAGGSQPFSGPAVFGIGQEPVYIPGLDFAPPGAVDICIGEAAFLGELDMGGELLFAGDIALGTILYDTSGEPNGFLSASETQSVIGTIPLTGGELPFDPDNPHACQIPEPPTCTMLFIGLLALAGVAWRHSSDHELSIGRGSRRG